MQRIDQIIGTIPRKTTAFPSMRYSERRPTLFNDDERDERTNVCPDCNGTGWAFTRNQDKCIVCAPCKTCDALKRARVATLERLANIPDFTPRQSWNTCAAYLHAFSRISRARQNWLLLSGKSGAGKSTQAAQVARQIVRTYLAPTRFYNSVELFRSLRACARNEYEYSKIMNVVVSTKLVVFDDLFKDVPDARSFAFEDYKRPIIEALWTRYERRLPTIITTQVSPDVIRRFDDAIFGRIVEASSGFSVYLNNNATDWRIQSFVSKYQTNKTTAICG